jgi:hypothetical protein
VSSAKFAILAICTLGLLVPAFRSAVARNSPVDPLAEPTAGWATIYVARREWHIDIGFAEEDLAPPLNSLTADFPGVRYLFFGFGDRHYLTAKRQNIPIMLSALWPGPGLILATGLGATPGEAFGAVHVIPLSVTLEQSRAAQAFIWDSLSTHSEDISAYASGPYEGSLYFSAVPRYSAAHTCNTWAAEVLRAAGLPIRSAGVVFAGQLWVQTRRAGDPAAH